MPVIDYLNKYHENGNISKTFSAKAPKGSTREYLRSTGVNTLHLHRTASARKNSSAIDNGTTYTLSRTSDSSTYQSLKGASVFVEEGTTYGKTAWVQSNTYLTSFSGQTWVQFSGAGQITAGGGMTKTGNTLDVVGTANRITVNADSVDIASTYIGQSSIQYLGTVTVPNGLNF